MIVLGKNEWKYIVEKKWNQLPEGIDPTTREHFKYYKGYVFFYTKYIIGGLGGLGSNICPTTNRDGTCTHYKIRVTHSGNTIVNNTCIDFYDPITR